MSRELLQQALMGDYPQLIAAVRQYLAQPEAEPVAYGMRNDGGQIFDCVGPDERARYPGDYTVPLYAAPQAQPAPAVNDRIHAPAAPAVPDDVLRALLKHNEELFAAYRARTAVPAVPAVPAVREPLTDAAITQLMPSGEYMMTPGELRDFARAIERAHGITGDSNG